MKHTAHSTSDQSFPLLSKFVFFSLFPCLFYSTYWVSVLPLFAYSQTCTHGFYYFVSRRCFFPPLFCAEADPEFTFNEYNLFKIFSIEPIILLNYEFKSNIYWVFTQLYVILRVESLYYISHRKLWVQIVAGRKHRPLLLRHFVVSTFYCSVFVLCLLFSTITDGYYSSRFIIALTWDEF